MNKKLYVRNPSFETSDAQLEELFGKAGKVESVRVMRDTETGLEGAALRLSKWPVDKTPKTRFQCLTNIR